MSSKNIFIRIFRGIVDMFLAGNRVKKLIRNLPQYREEVKKQNTLLFYKTLAFTSQHDLVEKSDRNKRITVSLTSFGGRIDYVHLVIESLGMQTVKADRIVLWLSEDEFSPETIPVMLNRMKARGLEIGYCKDLKSYNKIIPSLKKYPDDLIITVDDDIIYPEYMIEKLYKAYKKEPGVIHCHRGHRMSISENGKLKPYREWEWECNYPDESFMIFPTGVGGVLYYPGCFAEEVINEDMFMDLCPTADDVWLKAMSLKKGIKCRVIENPRLWREDNIDIAPVTDKGLFMINKHKNDEQINKVFSYFNLVEKLSEEDVPEKK